MRFLLLLAFYLSLASNALAVSDQLEVLFGTVTCGRSAMSSTTTTAKDCFEPRASDFIFVADVTNTSGTLPTADIRIQESDGVNGWVDVVSFTQITTVASLQKISSSNINYHRCFRAIATLAGTAPVYSVAIKVHYRMRP